MSFGDLVIGQTRFGGGKSRIWVSFEKPEYIRSRALTDICWQTIRTNSEAVRIAPRCRLLLGCKRVHGPEVLNINVSHGAEYERVVSARVLPSCVTWKALRDLLICKYAAAGRRISSNYMSDSMCGLCRGCFPPKISVHTLWSNSAWNPLCDCRLIDGPEVMASTFAPHY